LLKENEAKTSEDTEEEISTTSPENVAFPSEPDLAVDCIHHVEQSSTVSQNIYVFIPIKILLISQIYKLFRRRKMLPVKHPSV
jgi:hypothetical protein